MEEKYQSKTIQKSLDVLNLFKEHKKLSFTEIQEELKYNKSTLFRILYTLEKNNYLNKDKNKKYELGINIFILGNKMSKEKELIKISTSYIEELSKKTGMTVHLGILEDLNVVIINKANNYSGLQTLSRVGATVPVHCTGQGKVLLAYTEKEKVLKIINTYGLKRYTAHTITNTDELMKELEETRKRGYAIDNSEHEEHTYCIAFPIFNDTNEIVAALSITGLAIKFKEEEIEEKYIGMMNKIIDNMSKKMGYKK